MGRTFAQTSRFEKTAVDAFAGPEYMSEKQIRMYNLVGKHKSAKSGFVTSYSSPKSGKALLNYVFRRNGVKIRVYAGNVGEYAEILSDFPDNMKKDIMKAGDCKKLNGLNCSPTCTGGYSFPMDGVVYKKCKNMAFFHSLEKRNFAAVRKLVESEIDYADRG